MEAFVEFLKGVAYRGISLYLVLWECVIGMAVNIFTKYSGNLFSEYLK